jgi:flagellar biosynthetic protein FlhB
VSGKSGSGEKSEKPTAKKLKDSRKEGQVTRTPELGGWASMLAAAVLLHWGIGHTGETVRELFIRATGLIHHPTTTAATAMLHDGLLSAATVSVVIGAGVLLVNVLFAGAQGGIHIATKAMKPQLSRLNPLKGLKKILGPHALWELCKTALKTAAVGIVVWRSVTGLVPAADQLMSIQDVVALAASRVTAMIRDVALLGLLLAALDYAVIRRRVGKQLKMSKQEVKDEHRLSEGDPFIRGAMRARARAMARSRMMSDLPNADVIVTNPTHVAVALQYEPDKGAPTVIAKGMGPVAQRIKEAAKEHRIPTVEDVPLARALHASCEVGGAVPELLFEAVAQVLAFVLTMASRGHGSGHFRSPRADPSLPHLPDRVRRRIESKFSSLA